MALSDADYKTLSEALYAYAGTTIDARRAELLEARLHQIALTRGMTTLAPLFEGLREPHTPLARDVIDVLVNCETSFFRDTRAFEALRDFVIPTAMKTRAQVRRLRVLCAGCSTGQEAYSVAMLIRENFPELARWSVEISGVDVSAKRIERATEGRYSVLEVERGVSKALAAKYFQPAGDQLRIVAALRTITRFQRVNLAGRWQGLFGYDVILLRNVLIYLDEAAKTAMLSQARSAMHANGLLMLGAAESVSTSRHAFNRAAWTPYPVYTPRDG